MLGLDGFQKSYVIYRVGQVKSYICLQVGWVGQKSSKTCLRKYMNGPAGNKQFWNKVLHPNLSYIDQWIKDKILLYHCLFYFNSNCLLPQRKKLLPDAHFQLH